MENKTYPYQKEQIGGCLRNPYNSVLYKASENLEIPTTKIAETAYGIYVEALHAVKKAIIELGAETSDLIKVIDKLGVENHRIVED